MGEVGAFLRIERVENPERDPRERTEDFREFIITPPVEQLQEQGARCMECGVPFCHNGCPLGNLIPDWNDLVYRDRWHAAIDQLHATNNFPEFTGKLCPAPCEAACVLEIREGDAVSIKQIEVAIINRAFDEGWVVPRPPGFETGRTVAVVGAGPAGLAAAQQLRRRGHTVTVYERDEAGGGLVRFGVPDFKIEKWVVERRLDQLAAEGVRFEYGVDVGADVGAAELRERHDAVVIATGSRVPRDLPVPGRELDGVHYAMEYLYGRNRWVASDGDGVSPVTAAGKHVIVIGGGDTGSDCIGTSHRQGAQSVTSFEIMPRPPEERAGSTPWPLWPLMLRTSSSHEEGGARDWSVSTEHVSGENGKITKLHCVKVELKAGKFERVAGSEFEIPADLVLLAMGFVHPEHPGIVEGLGLTINNRGNIQVDESFATNQKGVFAAGDCQRGQSLVVWAIAEGRKAARACDLYLTGRSELP